MPESALGRGLEALIQDSQEEEEKKKHPKRMKLKRKPHPRRKNLKRNQHRKKLPKKIIIN
jgi:hypothetical protein